MMTFEEISLFLLSLKGAQKSFPFGEDAMVFKVMDKMFALLAWEKDPLTISLKCDPVEATILRRQYSSVIPGYHLNKDHWNTIAIDESIPDGEICHMVEESYRLVVQGLSKDKKNELLKL